MLAAARKDLGLMGRPNRITRDYASRHGDAFLTAPWCDQAVTFWARNSGNAAAVLPEGDRAYTVWHAEDGRDLGRWYAGTTANVRAHAVPGSVIFFDWDGTDTIGRIDHVGIVEVNLGDGRVQTIEANSGDACKRRVRGAEVIAGFWTPAYEDDATTAAARDWLEDIVNKLPLLKPGAKGWAVKRAFYLLISNGFPLDPKVVKDTEYSPAMAGQVAAFQRAHKLKVDKEIGPKTWLALILP